VCCKCVNNNIVSASTVTVKRLGVYRPRTNVTLAINSDDLRCINGRDEGVKSSSLTIPGNIYTAGIYIFFFLICISRDILNWYGALFRDRNESCYVSLFNSCQPYLI